MSIDIFGTGLSIFDFGGKLTRDLDPDSYGGFKTTLWFYQDNVAASQTAVELCLLGDAVRTQAPFVRAGSVLGIVVYSNAARSAGTLTVDATVNGTATGLQAVLNASNTQTHYNTQAKDTDALTAGQRIGVKLTTSADWAPTTADIIVGVEVET